MSIFAEISFGVVAKCSEMGGRLGNRYGLSLGKGEKVLGLSFSVGE